MIAHVICGILSSDASIDRLVSHLDNVPSIFSGVDVPPGFGYPSIHVSITSSSTDTTSRTTYSYSISARIDIMSDVAIGEKLVLDLSTLVRDSLHGSDIVDEGITYRVVCSRTYRNSKVDYVVYSIDLQLSSISQQEVI